MKYPREWEEVSKEVTEKTGEKWTTCRLKINGGWVVRHQIYAHGEITNCAICFVPDENHSWHLNSL